MDECEAEVDELELNALDACLRGRYEKQFLVNIHVFCLAGVFRTRTLVRWLYQDTSGSTVCQINWSTSPPVRDSASTSCASVRYRLKLSKHML